MVDKRGPRLNCSSQKCIVLIHAYKRSPNVLRIKAPMTLEMFAMSSDLDADRAFAAVPRSDREMEMELSIAEMVAGSRR